MSSQVRGAPGHSDNADIGAPARVRIEHEESVRPHLDTRDNLLSRPNPTCARVAEVGYVLVWALGMRFADTGYLNIRP